MKIAVLAHLKLPIGQPFGGGLEMHTHLLTHELQKRGHDVTLFAAEGSDPKLDPVVVCPPTGEAFGDPVRAASIDAAELAAYTTIMDKVAAGRFDIVHNNSLHELPLRESGEIAAPMLTVLHTPPFTSLEQAVVEALPRVRFAAVSPSLREEWRPLGVDAAVIGNGIDLETFGFCAEEVEGDLAFWSGRIVPEKGLHLAIDACRRAGFSLAFAGPQADAAYWCEAIAPRLGPGVTYLGHLAHRPLAARIGQARVAVVTPRWEEPFGLVVTEALACGTPVAGFARGALPDIVDRWCGRLAPADDVEGLALAIRESAELDRRACRSRAESLFNARAMIDSYEVLYAQMLQQSVGTPAQRIRGDQFLDGAGA